MPLQLRESYLQNENPERFINAFQLIAMSSDLDLSGFFQDEVIMHSS